MPPKSNVLRQSEWMDKTPRLLNPEKQTTDFTDATDSQIRRLRRRKKLSVPSVISVVLLVKRLDFTN
jgi:hypothetical protein